MIHAYDDYYLSITMKKIGEMFEYATLLLGIDIDDFASLFISSGMAEYFETMNHKYAVGKSSVELVAIMLDRDPETVEVNSAVTPEYWVGYALCYAQWYFNRPFKDIIKAFPCSELLNYYFPYHEMDITRVIDLIKTKYTITPPLVELRKKKGLSQAQLAKYSRVPLRTIKSYEQGTVDIAKAQAETLYLLSKTLFCTIEDLIR